jgi:hypothetical protein
MSKSFTRFSALIFILIGVAWLGAAAVLGGPGWDNLRPFLVVGGVVILALGVAVFILARRTARAD